MINCSDNTYYIYYTDASSGAIAIPIAKSSLIQPGDEVQLLGLNGTVYGAVGTLNGPSITLIGKTRLEYGEVFNANMLHLLEHFASPSDQKLTPDQLQTYQNLLSNPTVGQLWYNSTYKSMNVCVSVNPATWEPISDLSSVAGNSGILSDGEYIPLPIAFDGYEFAESECVWHVSPYFASPDEDVQSIDISADNRLVRCRYGTASGERLGLVNYIILGIKDYAVPAEYVVECPEPSPTPTISLTPTQTVTPPPTVTPTPTPTRTPAVTPTRTSTPVAASPTPTPTATPAATVTPTPTATPAATVTPTPSMVSPINLSAIPSNIIAINATADAAAALTFNVDGTWVAYENASIIGSGIWLTSGSTADYEFYYTYVDNSSPSYGDPGPGAGVWQNFPITLGVDDSDSSTTAAVSVNYTIRNKTNTSLQSSKSIGLNANGSCFAYGTLIKTTSGYSKVEDLRVGDTVLGFNIDGMVPESNGMWREWNTTDISTLEIKPVTVVSAISFNDFSYVNINGIISTMDHVYFVESDGKFCWKNASDLTTSDKLVSPSGDLIDIYQIEVSNEPNKFVALDVSPYDTLIVNNGIKDILAHNISA